MDGKESKERDPLHVANKSSFSGLFFNKTKLVLLALAFVVLVIIIIILAALLGKARSEERKVQTKGGGKHEGIPTTTGSPLPTTPGNEAWWRNRLPKNVIPLHYNLHMNLTVDELHFSGEVEIMVNVTSSTSLIMLHTNKLNVSDVAVKLPQQGSLPIKRHFWFKKHQYYVIEMKSPLDKNTYAVRMNFKGFYATLSALYRSKFRKPNGEESYFAATTFQPVWARDAFPCFDEPALKASFNVTIAHRPDYIALSNMPSYKTEMIKGQKIDYFQKSPIMSAYLVAFVVGDFEHTEITTNTKNKFKMRIYAREAALKEMDPFSSNISNDLLAFFEGYYKLAYPLPKLDMIALPDFPFGGMENWGLISYQEDALLWNKRQSVEEKTYVALVITHEVTHQWFGNIVTMKWWDDLWLSEAFASYMESTALSHVEPTWGMNNRFITSTHSAMSLDGLSNSHPIKFPVVGSGPDELEVIFDPIAYSKGACVLRMLENLLGNKTFADGLTIYLKKFAYGNADTDDLWAAMKQASCALGRCVNVKYILDTWTLQMGFPVVTLKKTSPNSIAVTQEHFLYNKNVNVTTESPFGYKWVIPFTYITNDQSNPELQWMHMNTTTIDWKGKWIKGNAGNKGFYLVNYEDNNWKELTLQLNTDHQVVSVNDRAGLIFDAFNLAKGSQLDYSIAFGITEYLSKETEYSPWLVTGMMMAYIQRLLPESSQAQKDLQKYLVHQGQTLYKTLGFRDGGSYLDIYKRKIILDMFCGAGIPSCVNNATTMFTAWMDDPQNYVVPANLRSIVYYNGIRYGGEKEWDFLYNQYNTSNSASDQKLMISALGASTVPWIVSRYLKYSLDARKFAKSVFEEVIKSVARSSASGRRFAWDFIRLSWDTIVTNIYGSPVRAYLTIVSDITDGFKTSFDLQEVKAFNDKMKTVSGTNIAQAQVIDAIRSNINWLRQNKKTVEEWLSEFIKKNKLQ